LKEREGKPFQSKREIHELLMNKTGLTLRMIKYYLRVLLEEGFISYYYNFNGWFVQVHWYMEKRR